MLSAKGHTINRLRSENDEVKQKYEESVREIRLLKQLQRKQERALDKFEGTESELPELLRKHSAEIDSLHQRVRKYKDRDRMKDKQLKEQHEELCKLQADLRKMKKVAGDKHLLERDSLQHKLEKQSEHIFEKEKRITELERYIENIRKNQNHHMNEVKTREQELKGQNATLEMENERLQVQLREKDKELDIRNIYSHRVIKPPVKLKTSKSPTSPRHMMVDKSTLTENLVPNPHPPEAPKRASSAEIRQQIYEKKTVEKEKKTPVEEKGKRVLPVEEKRELNEHELILQQLDFGIQLKEKEKKDDQDDVMKSLAMAKKRREEQQRMKEEEQNRKKEELAREKEEENRLKREEERLRLKKEEANQGYVPSFASIKKPSNLARPLALNAQSMAQPPQQSLKVNAKPLALNAQSMAQPPQQSLKVNAKPLTLSSNAQSMALPQQTLEVDAKQTNNLVTKRNSPETKPSLVRKDKPSWFSEIKTTNSSNSNMEKQRLEEDTAANKPNSFPKNSSLFTTSDDDDNVPYFGSNKPKKNQNSYAVNSVRGLQEYSERSSSAEKRSRPLGGKVLGEETTQKPTYNPSTFSNNGKVFEEEFNQTLMHNGNNAIANNKERKSELERVNREKEEAKRKKEELLAKMREIDQKNEKPESGRSRKNYKFTDPVENLHNGRPSHGLGSTASLQKEDDEDLAFGSYAPTFSKGASTKKKPDKPVANGYANDKKSDLLANLFSKGDSNGSSDNDDVLSSNTKAKPIKDKSAFPWDSGVDSGKETGGVKTGRRAVGVDNSLFGAEKKSPIIGKLAVNEVDDFEDNLEEVLL
ncbi:uncharacterized protein [Antedon mediterranea]